MYPTPEPYNNFIISDKDIKKDYGYRGEVLVGNWIEKRAKNIKVIQPTPFSVYKQDFKPNFDKLDRNEFNENVKNGWGSPMLRICADDKDEEDEFCKGYVTLNDLVYHHRIKKTIDADFGNLTRIGLRDKKNRVWNEQKRINTYETTYKFYYNEYPRECLQSEHRRKYRCFRQGHDYTTQKICYFMPHVPRSILPSL